MAAVDEVMPAPSVPRCAVTHSEIVADLRTALHLATLELEVVAGLVDRESRRSVQAMIHECRQTLARSG